MTTRKLEAGSPIDSHCLKCKELTGHTVIAMDGERVLKVQCRICGGRHALRTGPKARQAGAVRAKKTIVMAKKKDTVIIAWEEQMGNVDQSRALPYGMDKNFGRGDVIRHPQFGLGIVQSTQRPDKMQVLFQQGLKLMRCALK